MRGRKEIGGHLGDDLHRDSGFGFQRRGVDGVDRGQCGRKARQASVIGVQPQRADPLHGLQQRQQEQRIATRTDRNVLAGDSCRFRAARIDHNQCAASGQRLEPPRNTGRGHQAAVRGHRVGAEHEEIVGVVDVGDRQQELVPVHLRAGELMRPLVHGRSTEQVRRAQQAQQRREIRDMPEVVDIGIAQVSRHRRGAMGLLDRGQARTRQRERVVPADGAPTRTLAQHRHVQPVRVGFQIEDRIALRANMPLAEGIGGIAANRGQCAVLELQLQPADRLAQITRAIGSGAHGDAPGRGMPQADANPATPAAGEQKGVREHFRLKRVER